MKTLLVYYSRTGLTRKVANYISTKLKCDIDEVIDNKKRAGAMAYLSSGRDAMKLRLTSITFSKNPKDYDTIIIGSPVWAWTLTPAIRTYLDKNADALKVKRLAFFATQGSSGAEQLFEAIQKMLNIRPVSTLTVNGKDFRNDEFKTKADEFILPITSLQ